MRASSAPASLHRVAAWRASGSSCRSSDAPSRMPHTSASRSARPPASSRSSVTAAACSSSVRPRHRAWCRAVPVSWATRSRSAAGAQRSWFTVPGSNARALISSKLANYHGNRAVGLPWVVTFPVISHLPEPRPQTVAREPEPRCPASAGGRLMPRVALCRLNLAPGMAPMGSWRSSNYFYELEPRYGIEP